MARSNGIGRDRVAEVLDPECVRWVRQLARRLAGEGRTVLISSHLMSEMQQTADHLIVIGRGRILTDRRLDDLIDSGSAATVLVTSPDAALLADGLQRRGATSAAPVTKAPWALPQETSMTAAPMRDAIEAE